MMIARKSVRGDRLLSLAMVLVFNPPLALGMSPGSGTVCITPTGGWRMLHPAETVTVSPDAVEIRPRQGGPTWRWSLTSVDGPRTARSRVPEATGVSAETGAIRIDRGWIVEQYLARGGCVEQQFVIRERPELAGWLVITGRVECHGAFAREGAGWVWRDETGAVRLGSVYVFDAIGRQVPADMAVTATSTEIRINQADLADAVYPVTIDPTFGPDDFRISHMGLDGNVNFAAYAPAVAYNSTNDEFFVVWMGDDSSLANDENEIWGQRIRASDGALVGYRKRISDMGGNGNTTYQASRCAVAYNSTNNEYLVVWRGEDNVGGLVDNEFEIFAQRINAATGEEVGTNDFRISDMNGIGTPNGVADVPAVAYNSTNNEYLVVWRGHEESPSTALDEFEIWGQRLAADGTEIGENDFRISYTGPSRDINYAALDPDVSYLPSGNMYAVVWRADAIVDNEVEVYFREVNADGSLLPTTFRVSHMGPDGDTNYIGDAPRIAGGSVFVVWHGDNNVNDEYEISYGFPSVPPWQAQISDVGPTGDINYAGLMPSAAYNPDANEYLVAWQADDSTDGESEIYVRRVLIEPYMAARGPEMRISRVGPDGDTTFGAFEPRVAYSTVSHCYLVVWRGDDDVAPLVNDETEIFGQLFSTASTTQITSITPAQPRVGENVVVNFTVTGTSVTPSGDVTISDGMSNCTATVATGQCVLVPASGGTRTLTASYEGDQYHSRSTSPGVPLNVSLPLPVVTITGTTPNPSLVGEAVTISFTVTSGLGTPTGQVTLTDGVSVCSNTVEGGSCALTFSTAGTKSITATYAGDSNFGPAASPAVTHTVNELPPSSDTVPSGNGDGDGETPPPQCGACGPGAAGFVPLTSLLLVGIKRWGRRQT